MRLRNMLVILVGSAAASLVTPAHADDIAATAQTSGRIQLGQTVNGALETAGDKDWYAIDLKGAKPVWIMLVTRSSDTLGYPELQVYNAAGQHVYGHPVMARDDEGVGDDNFVFVFSPDADGKHFVEVQGLAKNGQPASGDYALSAGTLGNPTQNEEAAPGEWQTLFPAFAKRVAERQANHGPVFASDSSFTLRALGNGGCASERANMPGFLPVRFAGTFEKLEPVTGGQQRSHQSDFRVRLDIEGDDKSDSVAAFIYPAADSIETWRALAQGAKVTFAANVNCIVNIHVKKVAQLVTLSEAKPAN